MDVNSFLLDQRVQPYQELAHFIDNQQVISILNNKGIKYFFPIQFQTFDYIQNKCDLIGKDKTGSGKTIAYSLPVIQRFRMQRNLDGTTKLLIILPTRELTLQVKTQIQSLKKNQKQLRVTALYGGTSVGQQSRQLNRGADIVVGTPGRLMDIMYNRNFPFKDLQTVCLDEADQMLKLGFQQDIEEIFKLISQKSQQNVQKILFSATIPMWVQKLTEKFMSQRRIFIDLVKNNEIKTPVTIQHLSLCFTKNNRLLNAAIKNLIDMYVGKQGSLIIFCQTKAEAKSFFSSLQMTQTKRILHGQIPQNQRQATFKQFKSGKTKCLIATNVAARGLDIPSVDLIIQLEPPKKADDYVHRSGRTGRAGRSGICITIFKPQNWLKQGSNKLVNQIRHRQPNLMRDNQQCSAIFQDISKQLIQIYGPEKALGLALAQLSGIRTKPQQLSVQNNAPGFITCAFISQAQYDVNKTILIDYLKQKLQKFNEDMLCRIQNLAPHTLIFDLDEKFKKQIEKTQKQNEMLTEYKIQIILNEMMLKNYKDNDRIEYTIQQYEEAQYNKAKLELIVQNLANNVTEPMLLRFFKNQEIKVIQAKIIQKQNNYKKKAYILPLNKQQKAKLLNLKQQSLKLQNSQISISIPKNKYQQK